MALTCSEHAGRAAEFRCEGCRRALCADCVEESHRLWFCRLCRERALPIGAPATATPGARARERRLDRPVTLRDSLAYVFRGRGGFTLPAYVLFLTAGALLPFPFALLPIGVAALILPGFLLEIVRATAEGEDELPDWPDLSALGARALEWLQAAVVVAVSALPALLLRRLAGCDVELFLVADRASCALAWALGAALGYALAMFGFGALGAFRSGWLAPRLDLHLEALLAGTRADGPIVLAAIALLFAITAAVVRLLGGIPLVGLAVLHAATGYTLFTAAHLAGLLFRRHRQRLEAIYLR